MRRQCNPAHQKFTRRSEPVAIPPAQRSSGTIGMEWSIDLVGDRAARPNMGKVLKCTATAQRRLQYSPSMALASGVLTS